MAKVNDLKKALSKAKSAIKSSKMSERDRYNETLSLKRRMRFIAFRFTGTDGAATRSTMPTWLQRIRFAETVSAPNIKYMRQMRKSPPVILDVTLLLPVRFSIDLWAQSSSSRTKEKYA
jgi:hypothetical protein